MYFLHNFLPISCMLPSLNWAWEVLDFQNDHILIWTGQITHFEISLSQDIHVWNVKKKKYIGEEEVVISRLDQRAIIWHMWEYSVKLDADIVCWKCELFISPDILSVVGEQIRLKS